MKRVLLFGVLICAFKVANAQTTTFNYTGSLQTYTVPAGVTSINITSKGAQGGGDTYIGAVGGHGAILFGTFAVTPGQVLKVLVGGQGTTAQYVGGGGGGSFVWDNASSTLMMAAGGGGGGALNWPSYAFNGVDATTTLLGTNGGGGMSSGAGSSGNGGVTPSGYASWAGGGCGWYSAGNNGNYWWFCTYNCSGGSTPLGGGAGGVGGGDSPNNAPGGYGGGGGGNARCGAIGGGGGGGYSGGGAGGEVYLADYFPSGGGGGSYNGGTSTTASVGNTGNGQVIISVACTPPASIGGTTFSVCVGSTITLTDATSGGTWSSSATGIASVTSTGVVTGSSAGTVTISYSAGGCSATAVVTVNALPASISGTTALCAGTTTTLVDASGTGTWSSSNTSVATVGSTTGVVTGVSSGTATIIFVLSSTGCSTSTVVTVNPAPSPISGTLTLCQGNSSTLTDVTSGGTWSSAASGIAFINSTTGVMTGVSGGTTTISYIMTSGGCYATATAIINSQPAAISGASTLCLGNVTTYTDATGGGTWSSSSTTVASVGSTTGVITANTIGTASITYQITATGCFVTRTITINPVPAAIAGTQTVCLGSTTTLTDSITGGTWSSSLPGTASVTSTGVVTGNAVGTAVITYTEGTSCYATAIVTVLPLPSTISGITSFCAGATTSLTDASGGGTWSITGAGSSVGASTGIVSAITAGVDTVKYTLTATGCKTSIPVTVNPLPSAIAGVTSLCLLSTSTLSDASSGGTWSSTNPLIATVGSLSGVVSGLMLGVDTIRYTITATGCKTSIPVTIQPLPSLISGLGTVCAGQHLSLSDVSTGGIWLSSNSSIATIDSFSGVATGVSIGSVTISYSVNSCSITGIITVNPLPASITGTSWLCSNGATTNLSDITTTGSWSSSNTSIATIASSAPGSATVTSVAVGTSTITYTLPTGCFVTDVISVDPVPVPISGPSSVCNGSTVTLSDGTAGGNFSSSSTTIASVGSTTGVVLGNAVGTVLITYTLGSTGCLTYMPFVVNPILAVSTHITASTADTICSGRVVTYTAATSNGGSSPFYQWYVNSILMTGSSNTYTYAPSNNDLIDCKVTSNALCAIPATVTSNSIKMTVNPTTNPTVSMTSTQGDTICIGMSNTYSITSTGGGTSPAYLWTINWMPVATGITTYSYVPTNGDIVRCGMISSSPCPVPDTAFVIDTVTVKNYDTPKVVLINMDGVAVCQGNPVTILANPQYSGWGPMFYWTVNGNPVTASTSYTYYPTNGDIIHCTMISNYRCPVPTDTAKDNYTMKVDSLIIVTITGHPGMLITRGTYDTLFANIQFAGVDPTYQWYVNSVVVPGATNQTFITRDLKDKDSVSCVVRTGFGSACEGIKGHNWMIIVAAPAGLQQQSSTIGNIQIIPNPNSGQFSLEGKLNSDLKDAVLEITNVIGQLIYKRTIALNQGELHQLIEFGEEIPNGIYLLHVSTESGGAVMRFVINR